VTAEPVVSGWCDARFAAVRSEFTTNFRERGELGGAVCLSVRGRVVASLWGGWRDSAQRQPWTADTLVNVFSVGKGPLPAGSGRRCFGHFGAGGSVGFADPDTGLAFGYVTCQMGPRRRHLRNRALLDASYGGL
jgi:CubicO group peptidase (beta-lactamase class C family)